jgi:hypothetical protein
VDEAFKSFSRTLVELVEHNSVFGGEAFGQRLRMTAIGLELPVELDVQRGADGILRIGSTPPLYPLMTGIGPSYHRMRLRADDGSVTDEADDDG